MKLYSNCFVDIIDRNNLPRDVCLFVVVFGSKFNFVVFKFFLR